MMSIILISVKLSCLLRHKDTIVIVVPHIWSSTFVSVNSHRNKEFITNVKNLC